MEEDREAQELELQKAKIELALVKMKIEILDLFLETLEKGMK